MDKAFIIIVIQILFILFLCTLITLFIRLNRAIKLEKRVAKYTVRSNPVKENISQYDKVKKKYLLFVKKQRKKMKKLFPSASKRYEKYVLWENVQAIDYMTHKFVCALIFALIAIVTQAMRTKIISFIQLIISLVIGFIVPNIFLMIKKRLSRKEIEDDILRAVIVMNSAFKSGKSIIQAVAIVNQKVPGIIGLEFKKIYEELKYGLSVDTVFTRFAKRIKVEEAEYLSSSLTILNRTGGNIVAVFNSIEKTLLDKKKLKEELKNSLTVSNLVVKILLLIPFLFILVIYLFDTTYFDPFFKSPLGYLLLSLIFIMFTIYAHLLDRIVKVKY